MTKSSKDHMAPPKARQLIDPGAVILCLTVAAATKASYRRVPPTAMAVGLTLAIAPLVPLANSSLQRVPNLMQLSLVQRGKRTLAAFARKLPRYIANELVTMLPNLALWLVSSVIAASVLPATHFMLGIVAVSGPAPLKGVAHPVKPIFHGFGSVWAPFACLAVTALGDSWRLPLRRNFQAWYLAKTRKEVKHVPVTPAQKAKSLAEARQAATFSLITRAGLYYGLRNLVRLAWAPSRILLRRALTLHPAMPFNPDYWQMLECFLALQYQLTALMQCFWYAMSVCARVALPALEDQWGFMEAQLLNQRLAILVDSDVDEEQVLSDYLKASEVDVAERPNVAGPSRSAPQPVPVIPSGTEATASPQPSPLVCPTSVPTQSALTSKPHLPASSGFELSPSQRVALAAQRAAKKAAEDSRRIISEMKCRSSNSQPAKSSRVRTSDLATTSTGSEIALGKGLDRSPLPKHKDPKGKTREMQPQEAAECKYDQSDSRGLGSFGGEGGTGSYCVIEESTLCLPGQAIETAASEPEPQTEVEVKTEARAEGQPETTGTAGESSQEGLTRVSSSSSLPSSSSSASAAPADSTSSPTRRDRHLHRSSPSSDTSQFRNIDSFMDLNLEYATLRARPRDSNSGVQQPAGSTSASVSSSGSAADGGASGSYDREKRRYLQGARGSLARPSQW
ncbi:hypothetical protein BCV69DRAFT_280770 [Microstroma glucosiphilum]|uniref:Uncharacterized protein n=1 Tax=Pseudomicrostroma glucosiphilum TaxID=1684307 RepID=A0A316UD81_9BASI|nr:hypothetical protein BCV69DRAFT_280770 [Pseudomicrostroma glucosiphilum]PWN23156.1 hypothetical protein BCV69DRAFT_280770 [Pseudomicrostroma glucosiphilum]